LAKKVEAKPKQIKVNVGSEKVLEARVHNTAAQRPTAREKDGRRLRSFFLLSS
jgi:hypothetical protein